MVDVLTSHEQFIALAMLYKSVIIKTPEQIMGVLSTLKKNSHIKIKSLVIQGPELDDTMDAMHWGSFMARELQNLWITHAHTITHLKVAHLEGSRWPMAFPSTASTFSLLTHLDVEYTKSPTPRFIEPVLSMASALPQLATLQLCLNYGYYRAFKEIYTMQQLETLHIISTGWGLVRLANLNAPKLKTFINVWPQSPNIDGYQQKSIEALIAFASAHPTLQYVSTSLHHEADMIPLALHLMHVNIPHFDIFQGKNQANINQDIPLSAGKYAAHFCDQTWWDRNMGQSLALHHTTTEDMIMKNHSAICHMEEIGEIEEVEGVDAHILMDEYKNEVKLTCWSHGKQ
jgi:hypothetical protein